MDIHILYAKVGLSHIDEKIHVWVGDYTQLNAAYRLINKSQYGQLRPDAIEFIETHINEDNSENKHILPFGSYNLFHQTAFHR